MIPSEWRPYAAVIIAGMVLFLIYAIVDAQKFNSSVAAFENETFRATIVGKEDLNRGNFSLKFDTGYHQFYNVDLPGKQVAFDTFQIGDSVVKKSGGFIFDVYSKDNSGRFHFKYAAKW